MTELKWMNRIFGKQKDFDEDSAIEKRSVLSIPCDVIRPNRSQPRADFEDDALLRLAASIKRYGIIQPLTVRKADIDDIYEYELIAGERRLRAARLLELYSVPCVVLEADEQSSAELAIVENLMREDLNVFELAYGLRNLCEDYGLTQEEVAKKMSMSQSAVANKLRLLKLGYEEQRAIIELSLSERHARALLRLESSGERMSLIRRISEYSMTVKETEEYIDELLNPEPSEPIDKALAGANRSAGAIVRGIQKRLDTFQKGGKNASMDIKTSDGVIELHIRIEK